MLGTGSVPGRRTIVAFHQGLGWVAQISLFFLLGLLVFPSGLIDVAAGGPADLGRADVRRAPAGGPGREPPGPLLAARAADARLGGTARRGPDLARDLPRDRRDRRQRARSSTSSSSSSSPRRVVQGASFEPLARRLGLTTDEPALPQPLVESGTIRRLGGEVFAYRVEPDAAIVGRPVRDLRLPRQALVNVIVRGGEAIPPRGSTEIEGGDELHVLVRGEVREEVEELMRRWREGPLDEPPRPRLRPAARRRSSRCGPGSTHDGDAGRPERIAGVEVVQRLRTRRDAPGALLILADGRYACTGDGLVAVGPRRAVADWAARRVARAEGPAGEAWWQEVAGVLNAPARGARALARRLDAAGPARSAGRRRRFADGFELAVGMNRERRVTSCGCVQRCCAALVDSTSARRRRSGAGVWLESGGRMRSSPPASPASGHRSSAGRRGSRQPVIDAPQCPGPDADPTMTALPRLIADRVPPKTSTLLKSSRNDFKKAGRSYDCVLRSPRRARPANRSGLSSVFSRNGGIGPNRHASGTVLSYVVPQVAGRPRRCAVENPASTVSSSSSSSISVLRSAVRA